MKSDQAPFPGNQHGFTLLELLVVLVVLGFLLATLFPALANTRSNGRSFQCLNNNRRLCAAWRMYADENRDRLVYADNDRTGNPLNQYAWAQSQVDLNPANRENWDPVATIMKGPLWRYSGNDVNIYRCPSDQTYVVANGIARPRVRSMAMNLYLGGFAGTNAGWSTIAPYCLYTKLSEIGAGLPSPGPAKLFIFQDVRHEYTVWPSFATDMSGYLPNNPALHRFLDFPGMYHNGAATFSFADSHCEIHKWVDSRTTPVLPIFQFDENVASPRNADILWLQDHSTRPK